MRRSLLATGAVLAALAIAAAGPATVGGRTTSLLEFGSMTGVPAAYTGTQAPVRGINGGGLPWVIGSGRGELSTDGWLELKVRGLVIDPAAGGANAGSNPSPTFRAVVSCLTAAGGTQNVMSDPFPATTGLGAGNAKVETQLALPNPCIAPIVFVTNGTGAAWFAVTGG